jgi:hypothetical protein
MVENFICHPIGDTNQVVIATALGRNEYFPVESSVNILIGANENQFDLDFWNQ